MLKVAVTGGIGAGKSTASAELARFGAVVIDADQVARQVVEPGSAGLAAVVSEFGTSVLLADGRLDRPGLAAVVFGDPRALARLNAILHPLIARRTADLIAQAPDDAVVIHDMPLIVENDLGARHHLVLVVGAAEQVRLDRLVRLRGMDPEQARQRIAAQADDEARRRAADVWLDNSGPDPQAMLTQVGELYRQRLLPFERNLRAGVRAPAAAGVHVGPPDPSWPQQAARLTARIRWAVRDAADAVRRLDHIGSTAVPGLPAKDLIDLQLVVDDLGVADRVAGALAGAGFVRAPGQWWDEPQDGGHPAKRMHVACDPGRPVNLHVRAADSPAVREALALRDRLIAIPAEASAYAEVKRAAATGTQPGEPVGIQEYNRRKGPWVRAAVARALAEDATG